ncbi:acyl-CoA dehydrogenase C-terminal domain-containing protein [Oceanospirillaceae bacterium]|nr:acyl-CoA dehydrogenase C-terminal domain-containing protein [Oceanospirillaceae bacterium]MDC1341045.1 acyl-CoA dehydrogenase C-terminal domain-containing protein [Oceanospirillaceae bacterium]
MPSYRAPQRDIQFVMHEVLAMSDHYKTLQGNEDIDVQTIDAILEEASKFAENVLAPINASGDEQGCAWDDGHVTTPAGFKEAYARYVEGGWPSISHSPSVGGQGLPESLGTMINELSGTSNWSWSMYPGLSHGAMNTIETHGTDAQKTLYLLPLVEGRWTGTMCLTESHCGTDLGLLRTKAEPQADGSYAITGTKIFISAGEHDMVDNIVHIVLARLPGAPEGTKGISLFIVPKVNVNADGSLGERNQVKCGSLENKMGIHGNATCVMNFDGAKGYLIGPANKGLSCMFTFMNIARIGTAVQGLCSAEGAFQGALEYSKERLQMRSLAGPVEPEKPADPIIVHPDVRRMLLTAKAFAEGGRMLVYYLSQLNDTVTHNGTTDEAKEAEVLLSLLTPIAKAFMTETGLESANLGMQCFGGHGYIREYGMEQIVRDARISTIYEGTTGIQALDLLGRKVLMTQGQSLKAFTKKIHLFCKAEAGNEVMAEFIEPLMALNKEWGDLTMKVGMAALKDRNEVGAASVDYLMYSGYVTQAYLFARAAKISQDALAKGAGDIDFYQAKLFTAQFFFSRLLPRTQTHATTMLAGAGTLQGLDQEHFRF